MSDASNPAIVHSWTIPTPRGLWYQAFVFVDRGVFLTDRIDITTLKSIQKATALGTAATVKALTDHGRFKRPTFTPYDRLRGLRANHTGGTIELQVASDSGAPATLRANVPNRERLEALPDEFKSAVRRFAAHAS